MPSYLHCNLRLLNKIALVAVCLFPAGCVVLAQSNSNADQPSSETVNNLNQRLDELSKQVGELAQRSDKKDIELAELRVKLDSANSNLTTIVSILGVVLVIGTASSLFGFFRNEVRSTQAHEFALKSANQSEDRVTQAFELMRKGEQASQERADTIHQTFLVGSKETLDLVNETLTLAKESSARAAKIIEIRAQKMVAELDDESNRLLSSTSQDDRALVEDPVKRSKLKSLAQKITGFEINRFILPEDVQLAVQLTPACLFIRGMDFHLNEQFDEAIEIWYRVALAEKANNSLKSLAWYWRGYVQITLNDFNGAEESFSSALHLEFLNDERRYEIKRMLVETQFFNKNKKGYEAKNYIQPLEKLLADINQNKVSGELSVQKKKIAVTLANIISQVGRELTAEGKRDDARERFEEAKARYESVQPKDEWVLFGIAEMLYELGSENEAQKILREKVRDTVVRESARKEESRKKVIGLTTALICCLRVPEWESEIASFRTSVLQEVGRVDDRLTIYSQIQKRNVVKAEFQKELAELRLPTAAN